jgi:hypothetical protein
VDRNVLSELSCSIGGVVAVQVGDESPAVLPKVRLERGDVLRAERRQQQAAVAVIGERRVG